MDSGRGVDVAKIWVQPPFSAKSCGVRDHRVQNFCTAHAFRCAKIAIQIRSLARKHLIVLRNGLSSLRRSKPEHKMLWRATSGAVVLNSDAYPSPAPCSPYFWVPIPSHPLHLDFRFHASAHFTSKSDLHLARLAPRRVRNIWGTIFTDSRPCP